MDKSGEYPNIFKLLMRFVSETARKAIGPVFAVSAADVTERHLHLHLDVSASESSLDFISTVQYDSFHVYHFVHFHFSLM